MPKSLKIVLYAAATVMGLLILMAIIASYYLHANALRPYLEATAAQVTGMQVQIEGDIYIRLFPAVGLMLDRIKVENRGIPLAEADQVTLKIDLFSLLKKQPRVQGIALAHARVFIERDPKGLFNFEKTTKPHGVPRSLNLTNLSVTDGTFLYNDKKSGQELKAHGCGVKGNRLRLSGKSGVDLMKNIDLDMSVTCANMLSKKITAADVNITVRGAKGLYHLRPVGMRIFDGQGSAEAKADFSMDTPHWHVHSRLHRFRLEKLLKIIQPKYAVKGEVDFSAELYANGTQLEALKQTARGKASLRGDNLILIGRDLDKELKRYDSTRNFNLVDAGALFFAGPIGIAVTKGYDFSKLFQGKSGTTVIQEVISEWRIEHGIAEAQDVAIATRENYLALQGGLDFVNKRFEHLTLALIDPHGCTRIRQKIRGPFRQPVVEKPNVIQAVTAPVRKLLEKAKEAFTGPQCEVFYRGMLVTPDLPEGAPSG